MGIAHHFAAELGQYRELTDQEVTMLLGQRSGTPATSRRVRTAEDDRKLDRLRRKRHTAEAIATMLGRTPWAVRSRIRQRKRETASV